MSGDQPRFIKLAVLPLMYDRMGFKEVARRRPARPVVRLEVR